MRLEALEQDSFKPEEPDALRCAKTLNEDFETCVDAQDGLYKDPDISAEVWNAYQAMQKATFNAQKNAIYVAGRGVLGAGEFIEDATETVSVWAHSAAGDREAAEAELKTSFFEDRAAEWTQFMDVDESVEQIGDAAETAGEVAAGIGAAAVATAAFASASIPMGVAAAATGIAALGVAGENLDVNFENNDGRVTDEMLIESGLVAVGTAASIAVPGAIARHAATVESTATTATSKAATATERIETASTKVEQEQIAHATASVERPHTAATEVATYFDDAGKVYAKDNRLIPNESFEKNGYKYTTDELGRTSSVEGKLHLKTTERRETIKDSLSKIGKGSELANDERGHLIADMFGGSSELCNLVPMCEKVNRGSYKKWEMEMKKALEEGKEVYAKIEPIFEGKSHRPQSIQLTSTVDGIKTIRFIENVAEAL